ncbi:MAG: hypothetical protein C4554_05055 [Dethiobacter sp.]|nr:MAG: hypothetical protein C4554_05055 [Dethiobacter sp.]
MTYHLLGARADLGSIPETPASLGILAMRAHHGVFRAALVLLNTRLKNTGGVSLRVRCSNGFRGLILCQKVNASGVIKSFPAHA